MSERGGQQVGLLFTLSFKGEYKSLGLAFLSFITKFTDFCYIYIYFEPHFFSSAVLNPICILVLVCICTFLFID